MRIVDLSHKLIPGKEEYKLEVHTLFTDELLPQYHRPPEDWYILSEVNFLSHVGTHVEFPYHCLKDGRDASETPLELLIGRCVLIDVSHKENGKAIGARDLEESGASIEPGDIVFLRTGRSRNYRTKRQHERPYLTTGAIRWLIRKEIHCLGVDCSGIEKKGASRQINHKMLFENGIPLVEYLNNLGKLRAKEFTVFILPLNITGLEASPVRVIAVENGS